MIGLTQEEADFVRSGKKIKAIYLVRRRTNLGLVHAKGFVESWDGKTIVSESLGIQAACDRCRGSGKEPEKPTTPPMHQGARKTVDGNPFAWVECNHYSMAKGPEDCPTCLREKIRNMSEALKTSKTALYLAYDWMGRTPGDTYARAHLKEDRKQVVGILKGVHALTCSCPELKLREGEMATCSVCKLVGRKTP